MTKMNVLDQGVGGDQQILRFSQAEMRGIIAYGEGDFALFCDGKSAPDPVQKSQFPPIGKRRGGTVFGSGDQDSDIIADSKRGTDSLRQPQRFGTLDEAASAGSSVLVRDAFLDVVDFVFRGLAGFPLPATPSPEGAPADVIDTRLLTVSAMASGESPHS